MSTRSEKGYWLKEFITKSPFANDISIWFAQLSLAIQIISVSDHRNTKCQTLSRLTNTKWRNFFLVKYHHCLLPHGRSLPD